MSCCKLDLNWSKFAHLDLREGERVRIRVPLLIDKLHFEVVTHVVGYDFQVSLGKRLTKANSPAPEEGTESCRVSLGASRGQGQWMPRIEAIRQELSWTLPLLGVALKVIKVDHDGVASLYNELTDLSVLAEDLMA